MKTLRSLALALVAILTFTASVKYPTAPVEPPSLVLASAEAVIYSSAPTIEKGLVDWLFRGQAATLPTVLYLGLQTACQTTNAYSSGTEVVASSPGTAYQRVRVPAAGNLAMSATDGFAPAGAACSTSASTGATSTGVTSNCAQLTFPTPGTGSWGTVNCWTLVDAQCTSASSCTNVGTWGTVLSGSVTTPQAINTGQAAPYVAAGGLTITWTELEDFSPEEMQAVREIKSLEDFIAIYNARAYADRTGQRFDGIAYALALHALGQEGAFALATLPAANEAMAFNFATGAFGR
jgi:hypothetical protein